MPIMPVTNTIMKTTGLIEISEFDLANRKAKPIANVVEGLPAGSRTVAHHDSHELNRSRSFSEFNEFIPAVSVIYISSREWLPVVIVRVQMHRIVSRPVLDSELPGIRCAPMNPNGVDRLSRAEIDHNPLPMGVFGFASEMRIEIWIAFPK